MRNLDKIYEPGTIQEALELLRRPGTAVLAGGTNLMAEKRDDLTCVVALKHLGLSYIRSENGATAIGATTPLQQVADSALLRSIADGVIAQAAHRSAASLLRNQATLGGALIAEPAGILATALLALGGQVRISGGEAGETIALGQLLARRGQLLPAAILTQVLIPPLAKMRFALQTVARTPRDKPTISVCVAIDIQSGMVRSAAISIGGAGGTAFRAAEAEAVLAGHKPDGERIERAAAEAAHRAGPLSDYRGSTEYRLEMIRVLSARGLREVAVS